MYLCVTWVLHVTGKDESVMVRDNYLHLVAMFVVERRRAGGSIGMVEKKVY